eukprot:4182959-Lingulodinium_polyedra.AAC.1
MYNSARITGALDAITRAALGRSVRYDAAATMKAREGQFFASATDWVVELFGGIHLRYACARCH